MVLGKPSRAWRSLRQAASSGEREFAQVFPWHCLNFFPLPQGQGSLRRMFMVEVWRGEEHMSTGRKRARRLGWHQGPFVPHGAPPGVWICDHASVLVPAIPPRATRSQHQLEGEEVRSAAGGGSWCLEGVYKPRQTPTPSLSDTRESPRKPLKSQQLAGVGR